MRLLQLPDFSAREALQLTKLGATSALLPGSLRLVSPQTDK
jgi:hypothetical protein